MAKDPESNMLGIQGIRNLIKVIIESRRGTLDMETKQQIGILTTMVQSMGEQLGPAAKATAQRLYDAPSCPQWFRDVHDLFRVAGEE